MTRCFGKTEMGRDTRQAQQLSCQSRGARPEVPLLLPGWAASSKKCTKTEAAYKAVKEFCEASQRFQVPVPKLPVRLTKALGISALHRYHLSALDRA
jgi:hypothetical protein